MRPHTIPLLVTPVMLIWSQLALASGLRFAIDPGQDLEALARAGRVAVSVDRQGGVYTLDASAVLPVDLPDLLRASVDYDRYARMGIPYLRECHVVAAAPDRSLLYTWSAMSYFGQSSKHYLAVEIQRNLTPSGAAGIAWRLTRPQLGWPYADASAFTRLEGSWYLERLAERSTYVRYTLTAVLDPAIPEALVSWVVKRQLAEGTRGLVHALAREASVHP